METAPPSDPLRQFLSGKRRSERRACDLPIEVRSATATIPGRAVDVSEGGVLVFVDLKALAAMHEGAGLIEAMGVVDRHFKAACQLAFTTDQIRVPCSVVRLTEARSTTGVHLGCRFERPLSHAESLTLLAAVPPPVIAPLALTPKAGPELFGLLFSGGATASGPRFVGRLTGLAGPYVDLRVEPLRPTSPLAVTEALDGGTVLLRILRGGRPLHETEMRVASVRPALGRTPGVDVRLTSTKGDPPAAVLKHFEKRRG
jgi:hypothetical protein